jgi:hypothetical protein
MLLTPCKQENEKYLTVLETEIIAKIKYRRKSPFVCNIFQVFYVSNELLSYHLTDGSS